jgi:DNA polymerase-3 subunit epsilon
MREERFMSEKFDMQCVVELFGHSRIAGKVTEQAIGGATFIRVDVPKTTKRDGFTRFYGAGAIYSITPVDEQVAAAMAESLEVEPVSEWTLSLALRDKLIPATTGPAPDREDWDSSSEWSDDEKPYEVVTHVQSLPVPLNADHEEVPADPGEELAAIQIIAEADDKRAAADWARDLLKGEFVILDVETTGLGPEDEIVQIGIVDQTGAVVLDQLIKPQQSIPSDATAIHGITDETVKDAPPFDKVWIHIVAALAGKRVVAYNLKFDSGMLIQDCTRHGLASFMYSTDSACAMEEFAQFNGEWNEYHGNYRWKKLSEAMRILGVEFDGQQHSAISDCQATLAVIRKMAAYSVPPATADEDRGGNTVTVEGLEG